VVAHSFGLEKYWLKKLKILRTNMNNNPLENLKYKQITAIVFVLDYLQIQFDSAVLTFLEYPKVEINDVVFSFGEVEYRNRLCDLIGVTISDFSYIEDEQFGLLLKDSKIYCSLNPLEYNAPEKVIFNDGNKNIVAF
jgi:hypothetical protein